MALTAASAEIKRRWIAPEARGLGRRLLALYRSTGWVEVPAFNDEPFADHWLEKSLG